MKTVFITLVSVLSIILLTSVGIKNHEEFLKEHSPNVEAYSGNVNYEIEENLSSDNDVSTFDGGKIIKIEDVKVYEVEEDIQLGFDTQDYLPVDFNPYQGLNSDEELDFEDKLMFTTVFGNVTIEEVVEIENIILYEIDETM